MRLLKAKQDGGFEFTKNMIDRIPRYAILSHAWGADEDEISFDDFIGGNYKDKAGFAKLDFCAKQVKKPSSRASGLQNVHHGSYCMLGILGVSLPIIYGEDGKNTSSRLKQALIDKYRNNELAGLQQILDSGSGNEQTNPVSPMLERASLQTRRKAVLDSLAFKQMDSRRATIKSEHASTCSWMLEHFVYRAWTDPDKLPQHHGFLWLAGKPGSGKSTMMKFVHAQSAKGQCKTDIVLSFFFNARGGEMEKTTIGLYRALLFQLLKKAPDLYPRLEAYLRGQNSDEAMSIPEWTPELLCDLIVELLPGLGDRRLQCFIDALDECNEQQISAMIYFFEDLGHMAMQKGIQVYTCFASRHYPTLDIEYGLRLRLEHLKEHDDDMEKYIERYLRAGRGKRFDKVKALVKQKAKGVFLWVVLVVPLLNDEFKRGNIRAVERKLHEIPTELSEFFRDMVRRDSENMPEFRLSLQWVLFAQQPLSPKEYYFAMLAGLEPNALPTIDPEEIDDEDMEKYMLSSSKGLAELTKLKSPTVQFIHESVRDFLLKDGGLNDLWPDIGPDMVTLESQCHDQLKQCCSTCIQLDFTGFPALSKDLPPPRSTETAGLRERMSTQYPFLEYAKTNIFYHADAAARSISQSMFVKDFAFRSWINLHNLFESRQTDRYPLNLGPSYLFAEKGIVRLLTDINGHAVAFSKFSGAQYRYPILAAIAYNQVEAAHALLPHCSEDLLRQAWPEAKLEERFLAALASGAPPVYWASEQTYDALVEIFLGDSNAVFALTSYEIDALFKRASGLPSIKRLLETRTDAVHADSLLLSAARHGLADTVKLLLDNGADVNAVSPQGESALYVASQRASVKIASLLLDRGADVNAQEGRWDNALNAAALEGHGDIVKLLLEKGANVNAQGERFGNALNLAAFSGRLDIVKLLLEKGANINPAGGWSVKLSANTAYQGHLDIVKLLLDNGAKLIDDRNALSFTARDHYAKIAKLLLDNGANKSWLSKDEQRELSRLLSNIRTDPSPAP